MQLSPDIEVLRLFYTILSFLYLFFIYAFSPQVLIDVPKNGKARKSTRKMRGGRHGSVKNMNIQILIMGVEKRDCVSSFSFNTSFSSYLKNLAGQSISYLITVKIYFIFSQYLLTLSVSNLCPFVLKKWRLAARYTLRSKEEQNE